MHPGAKIPNVAFHAVLLILKEIEPFSPMKAQEHLESPKPKAIRNMIEELVRRRLVFRSMISSVRRPLYNITHMTRVSLPKSLNEAFVPKIKPKCLIDIDSPKLNRFYTDKYKK